MDSTPIATPTVSVLMSVYNNDRFLRAAIDSILNQSFTDFEFLITNDGSSDRSLKILQRYAAQDKRIRLSSRENRGIPKTRNEMLAQAKGDFIAVMDGDDVALPERFARQVAFLQQHPRVVCVGSHQFWIDEADRLLLTYHEPETDAEIQHYLLIGRTCINHPSSMMRRTAVLQVGGYNESLRTSSDLDLFLKLGEVGQLANLPEPLLKYRQHKGAISERSQLEQLDNKRKACEAAWQRRGIEGCFEETKPWRPIDRPTRYRYLLDYGWQFLRRGQRRDAFAYGLKAVRELPAAMEGWKLMYCALMKPAPNPESL